MRRQKRRDAPDHVYALIEQLRQHAPLWADRLSHAATDREFLDVLVKLFDLSSAGLPLRAEPRASSDLATQIARFLSANLHKGPTLKTLAEWLGISEKYCSELFQTIMGEPFSHYLAHQRKDIASTLLTTTDKSIRDIATAVGFADQFSFSHFFKRMTGLSPRAFRAKHVQRTLFDRLPSQRTNR
ncbi:MAG: AraC family transcriptional regulator [Nitrospira sp.]|nr:AraC family transcriptional regulator [Nitrospira sp.]MCP9443394.1 AraC family transcriptional regulator [Nitrospira sp.]